MTDGVIIWNFFGGELLLNNPQLDFTVFADHLTGEVKRYSAEFRGLSITVHPSGAFQIRGSLHKFKNQGEHNYDNFSYGELLRAITELINIFSIDPKEARITRLEVGVNIIPHIQTGDLLAALMLHKSRIFNSFRESGKHFKNVSYSEYEIKAYDKALQHDLPGQLFRFEIGLRKSKLKGTGVQVLADLKDPDIYKGVGEKLISEFNNCLIIDPPDYSKLNSRETLYIKDWMNPNHLGQLSTEYIRKGINRLRNFLDTNNLNNTHKIIADLIAEQISNSQYIKSTHIPFFPHVIIDTNKEISYPVFNHLDKEEKTGHHTPQAKTCVITGLDISMQDPGSKYITPVGLNYYKENNPEKYDAVIADFGPCDTSLDQDTNFYRISHRIRNYTSNQWRTMRNLEKRYQGNYSLFENNHLYGNRATLALLCNKKINATCHSNQE